MNITYIMSARLYSQKLNALETIKVSPLCGPPPLLYVYLDKKFLFYMVVSSYSDRKLTEISFNYSLLKEGVLIK